MYITVLTGNSKHITVKKNVSLYVQENYVCEVHIMLFLSLIKVVWNETAGYFSFVTTYSAVCLFTKMTTLVIWSLLG